MDASLPQLNLPSSFHLNSPSNKGLIVDEIWKNELSELSPRFYIPEEDDAPYDACLDGKEWFDVKLIPAREKSYHSSYVYISHNEYLFGKKHDTRFVIYEEVGDIAKFLIVFTFACAKREGAITLFDQGKWVHCKATGKLEAPWSIEVSRILQKFTSAP